MQNLENPQPQKISTPDRILREMIVIQKLFELQLYEYNINNGIQWQDWIIQDEEGKGAASGKYINTYWLYSNTELFNLQSYKIELTERFERTQNLALFYNQLRTIKGKAKEVIDFFNENFTNKSARYVAGLEEYSKLNLHNAAIARSQMEAAAIVENCSLTELVQGDTHLPKIFRFSERRQFEFIYVTTPRELATICIHLLNFVDAFDIKPSETETNESRNPEFTTARQVLALHFLLKQCSINPVDKPSEVARFVQFLTGRELGTRRIQDTTLYKSVKSPFRLNDDKAIEDFRFIRTYFEAMNLPGIVAEIDKEIRLSEK